MTVCDIKFLMEAPTGTADTPQELHDIVDGALIQGGGWATFTFARDVALAVTQRTLYDSGPLGQKVVLGGSSWGLLSSRYSFARSKRDMRPNLQRRSPS